MKMKQRDQRKKKLGEYLENWEVLQCGHAKVVFVTFFPVA